VEIPAGCSILTDEWVLPTSRQNLFFLWGTSALLPQLRWVNWALAAVNDSTKGNWEIGRLVTSCSSGVIKGSYRTRSVKFRQDGPSVGSWNVAWKYWRRSCGERWWIDVNG
jgi:hypothetical protein